MNQNTPTCELHHCPMQHAFSVPWDVKRNIPNDFSEIYKCPICGYMMIFPLPTPDQVAGFYEFDYYTHNDSAAQPQAHEIPGFWDRARTRIAFSRDRGPLMEDVVQRALGANRSSTLCDIGAGGGELSAALAQRGYAVTAIEPDPRARAQALVRGLANGFKVLAGSAEQLPLSVLSEQYDVMALSHVLEHCRKPMDALRSARSILKPGGRLVCEVPNNWAWALLLQRGAWEMLDPPRHLHFFTARSLTEFALHAGFSSIAISYAQYQRQFSNDWIRKEQHHFWTLTQGGRPPVPALTMNTKGRSWLLLLATVLAPARYGYDSLRVVAVN